jgi:hypothetical protein
LRFCQNRFLFLFSRLSKKVEKTLWKTGTQ